MAWLLNMLSSLPAHAEFLQTLVIADTALDSSMTEFSNNIVHELCILDWPSCPNGENFMDLSMVLIMARKWFQHQFELIRK